MEDSSASQNDHGLIEEIRDGIIVVTKSPAPQSGYTITSLPNSSSNITQSQTSHLFSLFLISYFLPYLPLHLNLPPEDIHVIISTKSGTEKAAATFENVLKPVLNAVGLGETSYRALWTQSSDTVKEFAAGPLRKKAQDGVGQTVLLLSGDGGVVDIVNGLMQDNGTKSRYVLSISHHF